MLYQNSNSIGQGFFECVRYRDFNWVPHMHRHPELVLVREGEVLAEIEGRQEAIPAGSCALVLSNRVHRYESPKGSLADVCIISEDFAPSFFKSVKGKQPETAVFCCRPSVLEYAKTELFRPGEIPDHFLLKSAFYGVLAEYEHQVAFRDTPGENPSVFDRIIQYVTENYTENITLKSMAEALGYEQHYLSRCFHSRVPMHFSTYVNWYRVDAATELLRNTNLPITRIAMQSGFQSIRSFNRVFLTLTGKNPSQL